MLMGSILDSRLTLWWPPPPFGSDLCRHLRMETWLTGVVREQLESSSKAESFVSSVGWRASVPLLLRPDRSGMGKSDVCA